MARATTGAPSHRARRVLRVAGPLVLALGVLLTVAAFVDFFLAFGGEGPPRLFWMGFVGLPLVFAGGVMTSYGYLGAITSYQAGEVRPAVRTLAAAVREGFDGGAGEPACPECGAPAAPDAAYCSRCGVRLGPDDA